MPFKVQQPPEAHPLYHDTYKLLNNYRDTVWSVEVSNLDLQAVFRAEYGVPIDACLEALEIAGVDLSGTRIESHARSIDRSRKMLRLIDTAIGLMRRRHRKGELYYWILYYSFLSPQEYESTNEILTALEAHFPPMSVRTYYSHRKDAIDVLSSVLWGYTSRSCSPILDQCDAAPENSQDVGSCRIRPRFIPAFPGVADGKIDSPRHLPDGRT